LFVQAKLRELAGWCNSVQDVEELAGMRAFILQESEKVNTSPPLPLDLTA